ncbi:hypothetical protein BT93_H3615 [Corymbia citriodora subsp. variegata]|nr:hypothetical protein BT93_H3615 [Corymbia citriodora subsp. variegata]
MDADELQRQPCHLVAMPFPGRGHVNPMMNLCKILVSSRSRQHPPLIITFVVTEEWLGYIGSHPKPGNIRFATIPNVVPSEQLKAADFPGFYEAVMTKMEAPFEQLLDRLHPPVSAFLADVELLWGVGVGNRKNIPVASLWTMSASVFSMFHHFDKILQNGHFPVNFSEHGAQRVEYIPGISPTSVADLPTRADPRVLKRAVECVTQVSKAQYLLFTSLYELEPQVMDALEAEFSFPVLPVGPTIPFLDICSNHSTNSDNDPDYLSWLDSQPKRSVLYISLGSFLSVSMDQMDEIVAAMNESGVGYLLVARGETPRLNPKCGKRGFVVSWCEQLRVLCHPSVGGFWTHCGWNSTLEAVFAGIPMLTFPIFLDQPSNSKQIVEDWKTGWRVKNQADADEELLTGGKIRELVQRFMDLESSKGKEIRKRATEFKEICQRAIAEGGSSNRNLDAFIRHKSLGRTLET